MGNRYYDENAEQPRETSFFAKLFSFILIAFLLASSLFIGYYIGLTKPHVAQKMDFNLIITDLLEDKSHLHIDALSNLAKKGEGISTSIENNTLPIDSQGKKMIALTFDDGPGAHTNELLDILKAYDVKATFYMQGKSVSTYPNVVKRMYDEGHQLANHSYDHKSFTKITSDDVFDQINNTDNAIKNIVGKDIKINGVRPPYGAFNDSVQNIFKNNEKYIAMWSIDTLDWKLKDAGKISSFIIDNMDDGDIILLHDIHKTSVDAVKIILETIDLENYIFVTCDELIKRNGDNIEFGKKYTGISAPGENGGTDVKPKQPHSPPKKPVEAPIEIPPNVETSPNNEQKDTQSSEFENNSNWDDNANNFPDNFPEENSSGYGYNFD